MGGNGRNPPALRRVDDVSVPSVEHPILSLVVVLFGAGWKWLPKAVQALVQNTEPCYELILVDNGAEGDCEIPGALLVRSEGNVGFAAGSNHGAALARGETLCFLNSDTFVGPRWLPPLLRALDNGAGAVVPCKLNEDGTLQEAGAFVDPDGQAYVFGNGEDPDLPNYRFPREVDFGSASCLVLPRPTFIDLGGFDTAFFPCYYEDADLCFRLRATGRAVVYEPRSRVVHIRTASIPIEEAGAFAEANRHVFLDRWRATLAARPLYEDVAVSTHARLTARDLHATARMLVLDDERLALALVRRASRARVTCLCSGDDLDPLLVAGVEALLWPTQFERWLDERRGHYEIITGKGELLRTFDAVLRATQPGARRLETADLG